MNTLEKTLRALIIGGVFALLAIPFIRVDTLFFPFITGKNLAFRTIIEIIFAAWVFLALTIPAYRPKKSFILYAYSAFIAVMALATIFSVDPIKSFWSNFERMEGFVTHLHLFALFLVLTGTLKTEKLWERLLQTSIGASVLMSVYALLQFFGKIKIFQGQDRLEGTFGNSTYLAVYLLFHIFLSAYFLFKEKRTKQTWIIYGGIVLFETIILFLTQTRGAVLGLLGGILVAAFLSAVFGKARVRKTGAIILGSIVLLGGAFFAVRNTEFAQKTPGLERLATISLTDTTVQSRFRIWHMAWEGFLEKPILGWGQENFIYVFNKYYDPGLYAQEPWFDRAHNVFLDWLIAGGALGLLSYLALFGSGVYYLTHSSQEEHAKEGNGLTRGIRGLFTRMKGEETLVPRIILIALFAAYFIQNIFVFDNIGSYLMFFLVLAYIHTLYAHPWKGGWISEKKIGSFDFILLPALLAMLVITLYTVNAKPLFAGSTVIRALSEQSAEGPAHNQKLFEEAIAYHTFGSTEIREQFLQGAFSVGAAQTIDAQIRVAFINSARTNMESQIKEHPLDARAPLFLGSFLARFGEFDQGIQYLETARKLSPQKQYTLQELGAVYIAKGDTQKALDILKESYELDKDNKEAAVLYGVGALYNKDITLAETIFKNDLGDVVYPDERIANAYATIGQKAKAIAVLNKIAVANPLLKTRIDEIIKTLK